MSVCLCAFVLGISVPGRGGGLFGYVCGNVYILVQQSWCVGVLTSVNAALRATYLTTGG